MRWSAPDIYLYNHISGLPVEVTMEAIGSVSSIALIVFLAAKHRYSSSNAMFLTHPTTLSPQVGMSAERLDAALRAALADDARTERILRARTTIPDQILHDRRPIVRRSSPLSTSFSFQTETVPPKARSYPESLAASSWNRA